VVNGGIYVSPPWWLLVRYIIKNLGWNSLNWDWIFLNRKYAFQNPRKLLTFSGWKLPLFLCISNIFWMQRFWSLDQSTTVTFTIQTFGRSYNTPRESDRRLHYTSQLRSIPNSHILLLSMPWTEVELVKLSCHANSHILDKKSCHGSRHTWSATQRDSAENHSPVTKKCRKAFHRQCMYPRWCAPTGTCGTCGRYCELILRRVRAWYGLLLAARPVAVSTKLVTRPYSLKESV